MRLALKCACGNRDDMEVAPPCSAECGREMEPARDEQAAAIEREAYHLCRLLGESMEQFDRLAKLHFMSPFETDVTLMRKQLSAIRGRVSEEAKCPMV